MSKSEQLIDVQELINELGVDGLCRMAEDYYKRIESWDYQMALPFTSIDETPEMLIHFAQLLQGLHPLPGMTVLDFGAGACWSSRILTQLGYQSIALDVSETALKCGAELYTRHPVFGTRPEPRFLHFDGYRIELPDESVDRISCLNSFHHVPNPEHVLQEMARVLKPGGIAGFSEPGPEHSRSAQSQYEMRMYKIVENDVKIEELWQAAQSFGFTDIKLAVFNSTSFLVSLPEFQSYIAPREPDAMPVEDEYENASLLKRVMRAIRNERPPVAPKPQVQHDPYAEHTRAYIQNHRLFFLYKGEMPAPDSRQRVGLLAEMEVNFASRVVAEGTPFLAHVKVRNSGSNIWLPISAPKGPVQLGAHLLDRDGLMVERDYFRQRLMEGDGRSILPGETLELTISVPSPAKGLHAISFDLVSEGITWFEMNGSQTVRVDVEVT